VPGKKELKLQCKIAGFPAPTIKWFRDGNEIKIRKGKFLFSCHSLIPGNGVSSVLPGDRISFG